MESVRRVLPALWRLANQETRVMIQLKPAPPRGSSNHHLSEALQLRRRFSQYCGSSSKHPRHAAGISLSSDTLFSLLVHLTTFWMVHSLLLHYFFLVPSSFQLTAHTPQRPGSNRNNICANALSCKQGRGYIASPIKLRKGFSCNTLIELSSYFAHAFQT